MRVAFFFQTALHWAAKHGNMDLVKMLAGTYTANVNAKTVSKTNDRVLFMFLCYIIFRRAISTIITIILYLSFTHK